MHKFMISYGHLLPDRAEQKRARKLHDELWSEQGKGGAHLGRMSVALSGVPASIETALLLGITNFRIDRGLSEPEETIEPQPSGPARVGSFIMPASTHHFAWELLRRTDLAEVNIVSPRVLAACAVLRHRHDPWNQAMPDAVTGMTFGQFDIPLL